MLDLLGILTNRPGCRAVLQSEPVDKDLLAALLAYMQVSGCHCTSGAKFSLARGVYVAWRD